MKIRIRRAEATDIPAITALQLADASGREALNENLWKLAPDAEARILAALDTIANPVTGPFTHHWLVAEEDGAIQGVAHGANVPAPPIIDLAGGTAGVLLDDCHFDGEQISGPLLTATEAAMAQTGSALFVAASPSGWHTRTRALKKAGYEPTTLYMAKTGFEEGTPSGLARNAAESDIEGITRLSARHRARLEDANPVFWRIHKEADTRFAAWMKTSLTLQGRSMFVAGPADDIRGYVIAQPGSPLHFAPAHNALRTGLIDDFYATAFEEHDDGRVALALVAAAETSFRERGVDTALAICPARMTSKSNLLEECGYRTASLWMVKS
jgi:hypothetical protein